MFDLKTQRMNKKGQVTHRQPYRLYVEKGVEKYERPPGSGQFFHRNGEPWKKSERVAQREKSPSKENSEE